VGATAPSINSSFSQVADKGHLRLTFDSRKYGIQLTEWFLEFQRFDFCGSDFEKEPMIFSDEVTIQFQSDEMFEGFGWQLQIECMRKIIIMLTVFDFI